MIDMSAMALASIQSILASLAVLQGADNLAEFAGELGEIDEQLWDMTESAKGRA